MQGNLSNLACKIAYMKLSDRIKHRRTVLFLTQEELAKKVGVSRVSVSQWERGDTSPKGDNFFSLSKALACSAEWLIDGKGDPDFNNVVPASVVGHNIPVLSYVQAGNWCESQAYSGADGDIEYVNADVDDDSRAFAVWVQGSSMTPEFNEGDLIIIDPDVVPLPGDFVVAKNGGEECTFKKYRPRGHKEDGSEIFELVPLNEDYPTLRSEISPIHIIGTMIEHRKFRRRKR